MCILGRGPELGPRLAACFASAASRLYSTSCLGKERAKERQSLFGCNNLIYFIYPFLLLHSLAFFLILGLTPLFKYPSIFIFILLSTTPSFLHLLLLTLLVFVLLTLLLFLPLVPFLTFLLFSSSISAYEYVSW